MGKITGIANSDSPQGKETFEIMKKIYDGLWLTDGSADRLLENHKFWEEFKALAKKRSCGEQYADEFVKTEKRYPEEYKVKDIKEQIDVIAGVFQLNPTNAKSFIKKLPEYPPIERAEGWFALAKSESVVKNSSLNPSQVQYEAIKIILQILNICDNCRGHTLPEGNFKQSKKTLRFLSKIKEEQEGDIIIIPAQHGLKHQGKSNARTRETLLENEFGLGGFHVGCMRITHPERHKKGCLNTDCPGDRISYFKNTSFTEALSWGFSLNEEIICNIFKDIADEYSGPVTGFYFPTPC